MFNVKDKDVTKEKPNESLNSSTGNNSSMTAKSSRYGRVIKPKSFDIETIAKKPSRKSQKPNIEVHAMHQMNIVENEDKPKVTIAKPPKKRGKEKELYNIFVDESQSILMDSNISTQDSTTELESAENSVQLSVDLSPIPDSSSSRKKSKKKLDDALFNTIAENLAKITDARQSSVLENVKFNATQVTAGASTTSSSLQQEVMHHEDSRGNVSVDDKELPAIKVPTRRGRPKKSIKYEENIDIDAIHMYSDVFSGEQNQREETNTITCSTTLNEVTPKRRGRPSKKAALETSNEILNQSLFSPVENDVNVEIKEENFKTPITESIKRRKRTLKNSISEETPTTPTESIEQSQSSSSSPAMPVISSSPAILSLETDSTQSDENTSVIKRRGRPRLTPLTTVPDKDPKPNQPKFTCGNCQQLIAHSKWKAHEAMHIGVTWRIGIDEPIDVNDSQAMARTMIRYMKHKKIQYLKCEKCGEKKKSAVGYISHIEVCGLTPDEIKALKAECEFCKKLYRKVSLVSHQQGFCPVRRLEIAQKQADAAVNAVCESDANEPGEEVVYSESGRPKRIIKKITPTTKPVDDFIKVGLKITGGTFKNWSRQLSELQIIKCTNDGCTFTATEIKAMQSHYKQCRESIMQCKLCSLSNRSRDEMVQHIETVHADELKLNASDGEDFENSDDDFKGGDQTSSSDDDDYVDDDILEMQNDRRNRKHFKPAKRKRAIPLKRIMEEDTPAYWDMLQSYYTRILNTRSGYYRKAYEWTQEFVEQNYDLDALEFKSSLRDSIEHVRLPQREANKFFGLLESKSVKFLCKKQTEYTITKNETANDENWIDLDLFESVKSDHIKTQSAVIFCGGRIVTCDWLPFPKDYDGNQVLVVCSQSKGAKPINSTNFIPTEKCKNLIQLWSISTTPESAIEPIKFMYGIAYDDGPISTISFCPSDVYIASKRLAIAALPDTIGNINIISFPDNVSKSKGNVPPVIKVKAEIRLKLGFKADENVAQTVVQMTWSRIKGHKVLCAGFNTGLVAVWNFEHLNSSYLCQKDTADNVPVLLPQYTLMGALSYVTQLDLHADSDGSIRWLLIGGLDRKIRLYDLYDPQLMPFTSQIFKSRIISGTWPLHWPLYLTIIDAALTRMNGGLYIKPVLYTNNQPRSTNHFNDCEPSNLAFSDWLNTGLFGNDVGDLFMINFQQLLLHDRFDESSEQKVLSTTDVFIEPSPSDASENSPDRIRILFNDFDDTVFAPKMNTRVQPVEQHPYARITRVAVNPNESHHKLYAIGYELGFCRIHFIP